MSGGAAARNRRRRWVLPAAVLLLLLGLHLLSRPVIRVHAYVSSDGGWEGVEVPAKGRTLEMVEREFDAYRAATGEDRIVLLRKARKEWWCSWDCRDYATHRRWEIPQAPD